MLVSIIVIGFRGIDYEHEYEHEHDYEHDQEQTGLNSWDLAPSSVDASNLWGIDWGTGKRDKTGAHLCAMRKCHDATF